MRDFSWQYFSQTGDVDAYLLYKQIATVNAPFQEDEEQEAEEATEDSLHFMD